MHHILELSRDDVLTAVDTSQLKTKDNQ